MVVPDDLACSREGRLYADESGRLALRILRGAIEHASAFQAVL
jgi:hypothetical protein